MWPGFTRQGHTVAMAAPNAFGNSARETLDGVRVLRFPSAPLAG